MSWLDDVLSQHKEFESPTMFWYWSALAALSATLRDKVWLDKFAYKLYPNVYIMLHADSGMRKGPPVSMAKQLVSPLHLTKMIVGRSSIQGILKELGTSETLPDGTINKNVSAFICASELASSFVDDSAVTGILVDLYDRNYNTEAWKSTLKQEVFALNGATLTMLTATNEAMISELYGNREIKGGYFARTFIVREEELQTINSLMYPPKILPDYKKLSAYLFQVSKLRGELYMEPNTRKFFHDWYLEFRENAFKVKDETGTLSRLDDSILKVAILISLGTVPEKVIHMFAIEKAIDICSKLVGNIRRAFVPDGRSLFTQEKFLLINELVNREGHMITRAQLNRKYWMRASMADWDTITDQLRVSEQIDITVIGNQVAYKMPDKVVEEWKAHYAGKIRKESI